MSELTKEQKIEVEEEIKSILRKNTNDIIDEVQQKLPYANRNQISGVISGLNTNNVIKCENGECHLV
jgi:hypothetical protein